MGVVSLVLPGAHLPPLPLTSPQPAQWHQTKSYNQSAQISTGKMRCFAVLFTVLCFVVLSIASPLDLGYGGVYDSPEANAYWARRFGGIFGGQVGLRSIMENINNQANRNNRP